MELFQRVAHQNGAGVIVVTHDQRTLEIFDTIYEMEDGTITSGGKTPERLHH
jgi:putative ABC transport system ATP-binding protein